MLLTSHNGYIMCEVLHEGNPLGMHTKAEDIYVRKFMQQIYNKVVASAIWINGASAMISENIGFVSKVKSDGNKDNFLCIT